MSFSASLLGATGLIGQHCLQLLLDDSEVTAVKTLSRRPLNITHPKLQTELGELNDLTAHASSLNADRLICCLGTTIKTAGSKSAFRCVDFDAVVEAAQLAKQQGTEHMIVISAVGADSQSPFFYNQVKGEMEDALQAIGFKRLDIIRPSLLLGERVERRLAEDLSKPLSRVFSPLLMGHLKRYRPVDGRDVAQKIVELCKSKGEGCHITYPTL